MKPEINKFKVQHIDRLPSVEKKLKTASWAEFRKLMLDRFGREHHELLIRQLLTIRQSGAVTDYIDKFSELVDQLTAYDGNTDPLYFTMRFIEGLRDDLRAPVLIQCPSTLDTAFVLAQLQDEVSTPGRRPDYKYEATRSSSKTTAWPLPPPPKPDKPNTIHAEDRRIADVARPKQAEEKFAALRSYRRAQGLCQYCAEKWHRGHKCADKIQLHALQEVMDIFQSSDDNGSTAGTSQAEEQLFLTLPVTAISGVPTPKTMCLPGQIQGTPIRILVDSGSSRTFISSAIASQLTNFNPVPAVSPCGGEPQGGWVGCDGGGLEGQ